MHRNTLEEATVFPSFLFTFGHCTMLVLIIFFIAVLWVLPVEDTDTAAATIEATDSLGIGAQVEVVSETILIDPKQAGTTGKKGEAFMLYAVALQCRCTACILSDVHGFNQ